MKKRVWVIWFLSFVLVLYSAPAFAQTVVFDSIPHPMPGNVVSLGFQATGTSEFGDMVKLAPGGRRAASASVVMSNWAKRSTYPWLPVAGFQLPITLSLYSDQGNAAARIPFASVTRTFTVPWRPEADPTCPGDRWRYSATDCFSGLAFQIDFDLKSLNLDLPEQFIYGVSYNTNTWGYNPQGVPGPYESLNVGLSGTNSVGTDVDPDVVFWNTAHKSWYTDGGAGGYNLFRPDTGWTGYVPTVQFTAASVATTADQCKNGGWANLVRADFTGFPNQGLCVKYVNTGK